MTGITKAGGCKIFMQISNREDTEQSPASVGISLSLNTDAPTIVNIIKTKEYNKLQEEFNQIKTNFYRCNVNVLKAGFITDDIREVLLQKMVEEFEAFVQC